MLKRVLLMTAVVGISAVSINQSVAAGEELTGDPTHAHFEGREIDLSESWEGAKACVELGDHTECFRTEAAMLRAHPELDDSAKASTTESTDGSAVLLAVNCSSSLRLYRQASYGGGSLSLTTRGVVLNLAGFSFDNDTSSYRVGACSAVFWSGASGSGPTYPGNTGAYASASFMATGWDNAVSSVYIY